MVRFIIAVCLGLSLTSCNNKLAQKCAEAYPCRDSTTYVKIGITDSIPYITYDTLYYNLGDTSNWSERFKPSISQGRIISGWSGVAPEFNQYPVDTLLNGFKYIKPVIKYKYITRQGLQKTVKVRDTAKEKVLQDKVDELKTKLENKNSSQIKWPWAITAIFALICLLTKRRNNN